MKCHFALLLGFCFPFTINVNAVLVDSYLIMAAHCVADGLILIALKLGSTFKGRNLLPEKPVILFKELILRLNIKKTPILGSCVQALIAKKRLTETQLPIALQF